MIEAAPGQTEANRPVPASHRKLSFSIGADGPPAGLAIQEDAIYHPKDHSILLIQSHDSVQIFTPTALRAQPSRVLDRQNMTARATFGRPCGCPHLSAADRLFAQKRRQATLSSPRAA
ncbi:hypothetical protein [Bradyrhizobium sp. SZCCHNRI1009]|uniref:hypothetical protein n=1 Tax=Bradyrhizobium sp. SZCCHNRI1009 TaxID=3057277 RepID=UPI002916F582|nr:hypothetical protein [Bradyrhizobium sp. SZCCHNRI1009]